MIDSSGSVQENHKNNLKHWNNIKDFVKQLISKFRISPFDYKFAVEKFGNDIKTLFNLNDSPKLNNYIKKIDTDLGKPNGKTNLLGAIKTMEELFENGKGNRENTIDIFVLLTDGYPNPAWQAKYVLEAVNNLKNQKNVTFIGIGITNQVNETFMRQIAGDNFIYIQQFSQLAANLNKVYKRICEIKPLSVRFDQKSSGRKS